MLVSLLACSSGVEEALPAWRAAVGDAPCTGSLSSLLDKTQCAAWQYFFDSTGGATSWKVCSANRNDPCACTPEDGGVTCQGADIVHINLWDSKVAGPLPHSLGAISNLNTLLLSNNLLTGSIPSWLEGLTKLTAFDLHNNLLTGRVPPLNFATIQICGIGGTGNKFCDPLPPSASMCTAGGSIDTSAGTCPATPAPTPAPTPDPLAGGCSSCADMRAAWGKFAPGLWNPKVLQDGCLELKASCGSSVSMQCPAKVSENLAPPCSARGAGAADAGVIVGSLAGVACVIAGGRFYQRTRAANQAAAMGAGARSPMLDDVTSPAVAAADYGQL